MSWPPKPLGEILEQSGRHRAGDQDLPVLSITMKHGLVDQAYKFKKRVASSDTSNYRVAYKNELVVGFPIDEGVLGFQTKYPAGIVSPAYDIWKLRSELDSHIPYLERYLRSAQARASYASRMQGAVARRRSLTKTDFLNLEIPFPPLDDQIRIAHLLVKVEGMIAQRKQHLQQLDDLLESVFLDMFGDVRTKKSVHPWVAFRPYLKANSGKSSKGIVSEINTGIPIYGGNGVNGWAKEALYQEPVVIAGRVGQHCGVIHVSTEPCWVTDNAIVLSISDYSQLNTTYLSRAFQYAPIRERVKQLDLPFINQSMLLDYLLPLPPIDLQKRFSAIVGRVEGIKSRYQKSLADLETLYAALSQLAFKGELELSRVPMPGIQAEHIRSAAAEPVHNLVADSLSIHLPEIGTLLDEVQGPVRQQDILRFWLEAYCHQLGSKSFSVQHFMEQAITRLTELHPDDDLELSASDYEQIKAWVFEALSSGRLTQSINVTHHDEDTGEPVFGNMIELKASQP